MRYYASLLTLLWLCGAVVPALAQDAEAEQTALARSLFREGVEAANAGQFDQAVDRFRRARQIRPSPGISYNLAAALARVGHVVEATEVVRDVLDAPDASAQLRSQGEELLEELRRRVARLTIQLGGDPRGVQVHLDDRPVPPAALGVEMPVDPGSHTVTVLRAGRVVGTAAAQLDEGGSDEVTVDAAPPEPGDRAAQELPPPEVPSQPAAPAPAEEGGSVFGTWWFWTAALVLVAGGVLAGLALSGTFEEDPVSGNAMPGVLQWE